MNFLFNGILFSNLQIFWNIYGITIPAKYINSFHCKLTSLCIKGHSHFFLPPRIIEKISIYVIQFL